MTRSIGAFTVVGMGGVTRVIAIAMVVSVGLGATAAPGKTNPSKKRPPAPRSFRLPPAPATSAFGLDLMRARGRGNLVLSPDSVVAALAMTGTGGVGRTAEEMARTLQLKGPASFAAVGDLQRAIVAGQTAAAVGDSEAPTFEIANGLFLQQDLPFNPAFIAGAEEHFAAEPQTVDFQNDPAGALAAINSWVSEHTRGKIPRILDSLPQGMALALANAIYLDADWKHRFEVSDTRPGTFFGTAGKRSTPLMHQTEHLRYGTGPGYKAVSLPYRSSTLSMLVVLPVGQRLGALQSDLRGKDLNKVARRLSTRDVNLTLPRFHLHTEADLTATLMKLGMPTAFSDGANFSGMTMAADLKIAFVQHAADITVDETGTVAAGATVVGAKVKKRTSPVPFNANRPFLFFVRDDRTGTVLFAGRLTQPS